MKKTLLAFMMSISFVNIQGFAATNGTASWSYSGNTGPSNWGQLCANGPLQSPINIPSSVRNTPDLLNINYGATPLVIVDNGPTTVTHGHGVQVNFPAGKETINVNGTTYELMQLHFHTPSENELQGQSFPAEIHFVHQGPNGKVAVIAVFIKVGKANASLQNIINHIPSEIGQAMTVPGDNINPMALIPARENYYSFMGSLTTPPCSEGVEWMVMESPISASPAQIDALTNAAGGPNARPIQPLNHRNVTASVQKI